MSEKCEREQGSGASIGLGQAPSTSTTNDAPSRRGRAKPNEQDVIPLF